MKGVKEERDHCAAQCTASRPFLLRCADKRLYTAGRGPGWLAPGRAKLIAPRGQRVHDWPASAIGGPQPAPLTVSREWHSGLVWCHPHIGIRDNATLPHLFQTQVRMHLRTVSGLRLDNSEREVLE